MLTISLPADLLYELHTSSNWTWLWLIVPFGSTVLETLWGVNTWCDNSGAAVERECMTVSQTDTGLVRSLPSGGWGKHTAYSPAFITSLGSSNGLSTRHKHLACTLPLTGLHCQPYLYEVVIAKAMAINPYCNLGTQLTWCQFKRLNGSSICASQFYWARTLTHQPRRQVIALTTCCASCSASATWFVLGRQHIFNRCGCLSRIISFGKIRSILTGREIHLNLDCCGQFSSLAVTLVTGRKYLFGVSVAVWCTLDVYVACYSANALRKAADLQRQHFVSTCTAEEL